jgi:hypothetical protein
MLYPDVSHLILVACTWRMFLMLPAKMIEVALTRLLSHARPRIKISAFRGSLVASQRRRSKSVSQTPDAIPLHTIMVFQSQSLGLWLAVLSAYPLTVWCFFAVTSLPLFNSVPPVELLVRERGNFSLMNLDGKSTVGPRRETRHDKRKKDLSKEL